MNKQPVIFLDVDGVIAPFGHPTPHSFSVDCIVRLASIVRDTEALIVLSSSWRKVQELQRQLKDTLRTYGITLHGETPTINGWRGHEIQSWLDAHPETGHYVILDDDGDMLDGQLRKFVQTDPERGITNAIAYRAKYLLLNGPRAEGNA